jgi:hypothetical protein
MTWLWPQLICENAAQTAPRTGLSTSGQNRYLRAASLANTQEKSRRDSKAGPFETGTPEQNHDFNGPPRPTSSSKRRPRKHFPQENLVGFPGC